MKCPFSLCCISSLICSLSLTTISAGAQTSPGAYPAGYVIILDTEDRTGYVHYASGMDDTVNYSGPLGVNSTGAIDLAPSFGRYDMIKGHLEVTYHYRVRYTASYPSETLQTSFNGMESNVMRVSATSNSVSAPSVASVRPDGAGSLPVSALGQIFSYPGLPGVPGFPGSGFTGPGVASDARTSYTGKPVSLGTSGIDANGNPYKEGMVLLKVVLDISAPSGTAEAHDQMALSQAKTVMIARSENQGSVVDDDDNPLPGIYQPDEYNADGSRGTGDSRYNNRVDLPTTDDAAYGGATIGYDFGNVNWSASLIGSLWPYSDAFMALPLLAPMQPLAYREWHWYDGLSGQASGNTSSGRNSPGPDAFTQDPRPWHAYPYGPLYIAKYIPLDFLDEMQNAALPPPDVAHIFFHIIDTDNSYQNHHPEWNFDKTANFYATFHNRYEEATNQVTFPTPLSDNPWHLYHIPTTFSSQLGDLMQTVGLAPNQNPDGSPITGTGTFPWNPGSVTAYLETSISLSVNCEYAAAGADINSGRSVTQNVPGKNVPLTFVGTVYYQTIKNRTTFNYKHYLKGGRHMLGFNSDGTEILHKGQVDRPTGGISFVVWVQKAGSTWPESTALDLASM